MVVRRNVERGAGALLRSLLVSVDLTPSSDRVLGRVARLPLAQDARVSLLHVVPDDFPLQERRGAERDAHKALSEEARQLAQQLPETVNIDVLVKVGSPATEIAECARKQTAKLIVLGRGGGRVLREAFLGSTAERVIRSAQLPVLTVRLPARAAYGRPALALDLDLPADEVVRRMLQLLPPAPSVDVIHAVHVPYRGMTYPSLSTRDAEHRTAALRSSAAGELSKLLAAALEKLKLQPPDVPTWRTHVRNGSPRDVVERVTNKTETDLLVLGTHGHANVAYVLLGTVAGELLRSAKCDVLVVPPPAASRAR